MLSEQYSKYFIADGTNSGTLSGHTFEIRLPNVPSTMDVQSYLVVYEVYAEYLDLTRSDNNVEVFYVTYNVINKQKVNDYSYEVSANPQVWATSSNVDVTKGVLEEDGKYYLDLFYYQEE